MVINSIADVLPFWWWAWWRWFPSKRIVTKLWQFPRPQFHHFLPEGWWQLITKSPFQLKKGDNEDDYGGDDTAENLKDVIMCHYMWSNITTKDQKWCAHYMIWWNYMMKLYDMKLYDMMKLMKFRSTITSFAH